MKNESPQSSSSSSVLQEISEVLVKRLCEVPCALLGPSCRQLWPTKIAMWCGACVNHAAADTIRLAHAEIEGLQRENEALRIEHANKAVLGLDAAERAKAAEARAEAAEGRFATAEDGRLSALRHCARLEKQIVAREGTTPPTASPVRDAGEGEQPTKSVGAVNTVGPLPTSPGRATEGATE